MRLFGKVDGSIDRFERASWVTILFDLPLSAGIYTEGITIKSTLGQAKSLTSTLGQALTIKSTLATALEIDSELS